MMQTRITKLLEIEYPIIQGGMRSEEHTSELQSQR